MRRVVVKLVALIAVLLLPLGMAPAGAVAHQQPMTMHMPKAHCPEQSSHHDLKGGIAQCTMACAGALPAADLAQDEHVPIVCTPLEPAAEQALHGVHPDTVTPPPKRS